MFGHVLLATDFRSPSARAEGIAIDIAQRFDAKLTLVHVYENPLLRLQRRALHTADLVTPIREGADEALAAESCTGSCQSAECDQRIAPGLPGGPNPFGARLRARRPARARNPRASWASSCVARQRGGEARRLAPVPVLTAHAPAWITCARGRRTRVSRGGQSPRSQSPHRPGPSRGRCSRCASRPSSATQEGGDGASSPGSPSPSKGASRAPTPP